MLAVFDRSVAKCPEAMTGANSLCFVINGFASIFLLFGPKFCLSESWFVWLLPSRAQPTSSQDAAGNVPLVWGNGF